MKRPSDRGFTIYELLITLLIVGVVLTVGLPNFAEFTRNSRIAGTVNDLHSSFLVGRSEAAREKAPITICASANSMAANADCDGGSFDNGWIIFIDFDGDITRDAGMNENVLRRHPAVDDAIDITTQPAASYFSFSAAGLGRGNVNGAQALEAAFICDERGNRTAGGGYSAARYLVVTPMGRSSVVRDVDQIANAGGCP